MAYGVTPAGLVRPRLPEIRQEVVDEVRTQLRNRGLPDDIETRPDSIFGLLIDTFAERETALWEVAEGVYYAMYPYSATGVALDRAVSFAGVTRISAERSLCNVVCYGAQGTAIAAGSQIRSRITSNLWELVDSITISTTEAVDVRYIPEIQNSAQYKLTIDHVDYTYTSTSSATPSAILNGLVAQASGSGFDVTSDGSAIRIVSLGNSFSISASANLTLDRLGSQAPAQTIEKIPEAPRVGELNHIVTLINGWLAVNNMQDGTAGRLTETDAELRRRYVTGVFRFGAATLPAIQANIQQDVVGVSEVKVLENKTDNVVDGMVPHSIRVIVDGGLNEPIARAIYQNKAAGIDTNGDISVAIQTPEGAQTILFDRPERIYIWVRTQITLLPSGEGEQFPSSGFTLIRDNIMRRGSALGIGNDVIRQRFFTSIYEIPGIEVTVLEFAYDTNPNATPSPGDYVATNIPISDRRRAIFDPSRIEVL